MKNKTKTRVAKKDERSVLLKLERYDTKCAGKCLVKSTDYGSGVFIITGISHKCGK